MAAGYFKQLRPRHLKAGFVEIDRGDFSAGARETERYSAADAATAARRHAHAAGKAKPVG